MRPSGVGVVTSHLLALVAVIILLPQVGFGADAASPGGKSVRAANQGKTERIDTNTNKKGRSLGR
jgi:hypothetical protein